MERIVAGYPALRLFSLPSIAPDGQRRHLEPPAQVERGDDLAAQVDQAADHRGCHRHARHVLVAQDFLDGDHLDAEVLAVEHERAELPLAERRVTDQRRVEARRDDRNTI